jgi:hypothetical protein
MTTEVFDPKVPYAGAFWTMTTSDKFFDAPKVPEVSIDASGLGKTFSVKGQETKTVIVKTTDYFLSVIRGKIEGFRERIRSFRHLPEDWDSYGAGAIAEKVISNALLLIDQLEKCQIVPEKIAATADDSIFIRYWSNGAVREWEMHDDGESVVVDLDSDGKRRYKAVPANLIPDFVIAS